MGDTNGKILYPSLGKQIQHFKCEDNYGKYVYLNSIDKTTIKKVPPIEIVHNLHRSTVQLNQMKQQHEQLSERYNQASVDLKNANKEIHSLQKKLEECQQQHQHQLQAAAAAAAAPPPLPLLKKKCGPQQASQYRIDPTQWLQ
ncbi:hypothetical protein RFI_12148 [Reticulomyxa filosa]|uniref:Uncharacterized protein n=1 Tax=Reticulomyxa filosa TaxID=46433 RepID=X6NG90_RETFI|nr:hypothetical protein RFI_12148 [Reticulomyxa filosa]|eukprot:ETO24996.1 hypothetical protein RFI_12148 [Reticulomyxa filosa]